MAVQEEKECPQLALKPKGCTERRVSIIPNLRQTEGHSKPAYRKDLNLDEAPIPEAPSTPCKLPWSLPRDRVYEINDATGICGKCQSFITTALSLQP
jgi:hypothetical protein